MSSENVAVIGAGSYGTCLAKLFGDVGHRVALYCRGADAAETMQRDRTNATYLAGHMFPETIRVTCDLADAVRSAIASGKPYLIDANIGADKNPGGAGVWELPGLGVSAPVIGGRYRAE